MVDNASSSSALLAPSSNSSSNTNCISNSGHQNTSNDEDGSCNLDKVSSSHDCTADAIPRLFQLFPSSSSTSTAIPAVDRPQLSDQSLTHNQELTTSVPSSTSRNTDVSSSTAVSTPGAETQMQPIVSQHHMITRSKNGIFKSRVFLSECNFPSGFLIEWDPKSIKSAARSEMV
ncbi:hypothetical protein LWI29_018349 [Acer saccharum]|uniref:Uncharacterized protein n=1 Tax=Acer saccharum TaxID=4024 RepID=A0AA39VVQ1_ACESA|nr:hypothetical protein LWI29_018349 [Acer saccharum]